jgi:hypothetical protein
VWLNIGLALLVAAALALLLSGCTAGPFVGPNTMRCTGGATAIHYAPDYQKVVCGDELVITGAMSDNAATTSAGVLGFLAGWLAP